jgi:hypothetical protein
MRDPALVILQQHHPLIIRHHRSRALHPSVMRTSTGSAQRGILKVLLTL